MGFDSLFNVAMIMEWFSFSFFEGFKGFGVLGYEVGEHCCLRAVPKPYNKQVPTASSSQKERAIMARARALNGR